LRSCEKNGGLSTICELAFAHELIDGQEPVAAPLRSGLAADELDLLSDAGSSGQLPVARQQGRVKRFRERNVHGVVGSHVLAERPYSDRKSVV
jgi:hypothetical protein